MKSYERHVHTHTHTLYTLNVVYVHVDHNVCVHSIRISYMLCTLPSIPCEWNGYNIRIYYTWIYGWLCTRFADGMPLFSSFVGSSFTWSHHQCIRCVTWMWLLLLLASRTHKTHKHRYTTYPYIMSSTRQAIGHEINNSSNAASLSGIMTPCHG